MSQSRQFQMLLLFGLAAMLIACTGVPGDVSTAPEDGSRPPGWLAEWGNPHHSDSAPSGSGIWLVQSVCGHLAPFDLSGPAFEVVDIQTACVPDGARETPVRAFVLLRDTSTREALWLTSPGGRCPHTISDMTFSATVGDHLQLSMSDMVWEEEYEAYTIWSNQVLYIRGDGTYSVAGVEFALADGIESLREVAASPDSSDECPVELLDRSSEPLPQHPDAPRLVPDPDMDR